MFNFSAAFLMDCSLATSMKVKISRESADIASYRAVISNTMRDSLSLAQQYFSDIVSRA